MNKTGSNPGLRAGLMCGIYTAVYIIVFITFQSAVAIAGEGSGISLGFPFNAKAPEIPKNILPESGSSEFSYDVIMEASAFDDPDDRHTASQWDIFGSNDYYIVKWNSGY